MNQDVQNHLDAALNDLRTLFMKAIARIEAIKPGEKIPATQLADELAKEQGMTGPQLYPTLKLLLDNYPGVLIRRGAHGGIFRPLPAAPLANPPTDGNDGEQTQNTSDGQ